MNIERVNTTLVKAISQLSEAEIEDGGLFEFTVLSPAEMSKRTGMKVPRSIQPKKSSYKVPSPAQMSKRAGMKLPTKMKWTLRMRTSNFEEWELVAGNVEASVGGFPNESSYEWRASEIEVPSGRRMKIKKGRASSLSDAKKAVEKAVKVLDKSIIKARELKTQDEATVGFWNLYLMGKLTAWDRKQRDGNIYRMGHLSDAAFNVQMDTKSIENQSSYAAIEKFRKAMNRRFETNFPPIKAMNKAIDRYHMTGKRPKYGK